MLYVLQVARSICYMLYMSHVFRLICDMFFMFHIVVTSNYDSFYITILQASIIFDLLLKFLLNDFLEFAAEDEIGLSWAWRVGMGIILVTVRKHEICN